jgi:septum formation protein
LTPAATRPRLVLASASPRRTELLSSIGVPHDVVPSPAAEPLAGSLPPDEHVLRSAILKARAVAAIRPGRLVLGADTVVALGRAPSDVLGKPSGAPDADRMLRLLSGRAHEVLTGIALVRDGHEVSVHSRTSVAFAPLGDLLDKAGAYAVQGRVAPWVTSLDGSWSNVVGLPLEALPGLFQEMGERLEAWQDW